MKRVGLELTDTAIYNDIFGLFRTSHIGRQHLYCVASAPHPQTDIPSSLIDHHPEKDDCQIRELVEEGECDIPWMSLKTVALGSPTSSSCPASDIFLMVEL